MEVCVVQFDGSRAAGRAVDAAMARYGGATAWLRGVAVIRRTGRGRVSMRLMSLDQPPGAAPATRGRAAQRVRDVLQIIELEELLELDASALVLIADRTSCDEMEATFAAESTRICRQDVLDDFDTTLRLLLDSSRAAGSEVVDD
jgi:hypothetical protein